MAASLAEPIWVGSEPGWTSGDSFDEPGEVVATGGPGSGFPLTAEEIQLRESAYRLRVQISDHTPISAIADPERDYAEYLSRLGYLHGPSRLAKIEQEIYADHDSLTKFAHVARNVLGADRVRIEAAMDQRTALSGAEKHEARIRVEENLVVIRRTFADIKRRIGSYAYAIDRTRIETPVLAIGSARASLDHLRDRAASLRHELTQPHGLAHRIGAYAPGPRPPKMSVGPDGPIDIRPPLRSLEAGP